MYLSIDNSVDKSIHAIKIVRELQRQLKLINHSKDDKAVNNIEPTY